MHPLAIILGNYFRHDGPVKRRTSLDNSCLSAHASIQLLLHSEDETDEYQNESRPRRLSLNNKATIAITFLAGLTPSTHRKDDDLDLDYHKSEHGVSPQRSSSEALTADTFEMEDESRFAMLRCKSLLTRNIFGRTWERVFGI
jgi:hypothetical protein